MNALKLHATPPELRHPPLIANQRGIAWLSDTIASLAEGAAPRWWKWALAVSLCLTILCFVMVAYLISAGIGIWGVNHPVMWGMAIVNFVWWIGIGHAGTLLSAILFLLRQRWRTSIHRVAEAMTLFAVICASIFPLIHLGRIWLAWWLLPIPTSNNLWPQFRSPLIWDVFAIATYFIVSVLFCYTGMIPDLAVMRDRAKTLPRKMFYGFFALGWTGSNRHWNHFEKAYLILAGLATALVISVHSIVAFDFAATQLPGWHSTLFPPYFVTGAIFSGLGMTLTLLIPLRVLLKLQDLITPRHIDLLCKVTLAVGSIILYFYGVEFFSAFYGGNKYEKFAFLQNRALNPIFWTMLLCNLAASQLFWFKKIRANMKVVFALSILVNIGMWLERFLIVIFPLQKDFLPSNWHAYCPTWVDYLTFIGSFGIFFTLFLLFIRFLPLIAIAEVKGIVKK